MNAVGEMELVLRGYQIPMVENVSLLDDIYDCIDLSDNEIRVLDDNFSLRTRLTTLVASNNHIDKISSQLVHQLPQLVNLVLTNNRISRFGEIDHLQGFIKLEHLYLLDNPISAYKGYREYVIHHIPSLKFLDFKKITPKERKAAAKFFKSKEGKILKDMRNSCNGSGSGSSSSSSSSSTSDKSIMSIEEKAVIRQAVQNATTKEQVDEIQRLLEAGNFPFHLYGL
jgi:U2 small nuclear ribonucleoprotein A'